MEPKSSKSWTSAVMMTFSILTTCVLVPLGFMAGGPFTAWLKSTGVHISPNLADGSPIAEFTGFERSLRDLPPGADASAFDQALAVRSLSVKKVAFRRFSGIGISPRVNLSFEFDGRLPDPQNSPRGFSMTTIHVYIRVPAGSSDPVRSERAAKVDFGGPGWNYQVVIDGFHDQARIFDVHGNLVASGLGLYIDYQKNPAGGTGAGSGRTRLTAALPMDYLGDPEQGDWQFYVLAGISDSRHPSMMLHSADNARPSAYCAALAAAPQATSGERPRLRPLARVPAPIASMEIPEISLNLYTSVWSNLPKPVQSVQPRPFEDYGQDYGFMIYRTRLIGHKSGKLTITDLHDYATVFLNGEYVGKLDRREGEGTIDLSRSDAKEPLLEILVEAMGRINFAQHMIDRKGITERVTLNGMTLMNWEVFGLPFDSRYIQSLKKASVGKGRTGVFFRGTFSLSEVADTYFDMTNYRKGVVWINGHNLGRFLEIGPQRRLYCPAPWLKNGENEILVFDLHQLEPKTVRGMKTLESPAGAPHGAM